MDESSPLKQHRLKQLLEFCSNFEDNVNEYLSNNILPDSEEIWRWSAMFRQEAYDLDSMHRKLRKFEEEKAA